MSVAPQMLARQVFVLIFLHSKRFCRFLACLRFGGRSDRLVLAPVKQSKWPSSAKLCRDTSLRTATTHQNRLNMPDTPKYTLAPWRFMGSYKQGLNRVESLVTILIAPHITTHIRI